MFKRKNLGWLFTILLVAVLAMNTIAGYAIHDNAVVQQAGGKPEKLVMVTSADYPPYEFRDTATGKDEIIGFDVDIAKHIAKELGFELEIRDTDFNGIISALQSGRADLAMAGMSPTSERKKNVDFSDIYYEGNNTIVAQKGSKLKKPEDLAGKKVGVQLGSIQEKIARDFKHVKLVSLNKTAEIIQEVKANRIQAAILTDTNAKRFTSNNPDLEFTTINNPDLEFTTIPKTEKGGSAIAFPKGSQRVDEFNRVLKGMKESGEIEMLVKKWFENSPESAITSKATSKTNFSFAKITPSIPLFIPQSYQGDRSNG